METKLCSLYPIECFEHEYFGASCRGCALKEMHDNQPKEIDASTAQLERLEAAGHAKHTREMR